MITEKTKPSTYIVELYGDWHSCDTKEEAEEFEKTFKTLVSRYEQAEANIQQRVKNYFEFQSYPEYRSDDEFKWGLMEDADVVGEILNGKRYAAGEFTNIEFFTTLEELQKNVEGKADDQHFTARDFSEYFDVIDLETDERFDIKLHVELVKRGN